MSRRSIAIVLVALLVGGLIGALVIGIFVEGDDDGDVAGPDATTTTTAAVSETGEELVELLSRGRERPFHATYTQPGADGAVLTVDVWRDGERVRQDLVLEGAGLRNHLAVFQLADGNVSCQRTDEEEWACARSVSTATEAGNPAGILDAVAADLGGKEVTATDETIDGRDVRCFQIVDEEAPSSELCVGNDGIPVRLSSAEAVLTLDALETEVDSSVFEPPAEV